MFEKSFPQSVRPTLRYISPEFDCRSPRYGALIRAKSPTNCDADHGNDFFTRFRTAVKNVL
ncbi:MULTISPECIES: DUF6783 domain-containing protein [unclassified Ruminococcus]|uniref:DUF6783 domain-containing protein n=1 Tax=unclassified Ruminococcus TaxID=2608920 RepID=UPI00319E9071